MYLISSYLSGYTKDVQDEIRRELIREHVLMHEICLVEESAACICVILLDTHKHAQCWYQCEKLKKTPETKEETGQHFEGVLD